MLRAEGITFALRGKPLIEAITLSFQPGMVHSVIGPNGSGKTTFLKTLSGIWKPTAGTVIWREQNLHKQRRQEISRTITLVPQNPHVTFDFTVEEFVAMGRYAHGTLGLHSALIEESLKQVDALQFRKRPVNQLSQGERQRVYIARSLATEASVLLFDEPVANLDLRHQIDIWVLLKQLATQGKTIVMTNHDLIGTQRYSDRVCLLNAGRCVAEGSFDHVITPQSLRDVFGLD